MNDTAIRLINPAAACPEWCISTHEHDWLVPDRTGYWSALHQSHPEPVISGERDVPKDAASHLIVQLEHFISDSEQSLPWLLYVTHTDGFGCAKDFNLTARQALRLAEVLVQRASAVLAEETVTKVQADR